MCEYCSSDTAGESLFSEGIAWMQTKVAKLDHDGLCESRDCERHRASAKVDAGDC